jgi:hypothetical protein
VKAAADSLAEDLCVFLYSTLMSKKHLLAVTICNDKFAASLFVPHSKRQACITILPVIRVASRPTDDNEVHELSV